MKLSVNYSTLKYLSFIHFKRWRCCGKIQDKLYGSDFWCDVNTLTYGRQYVCVRTMLKFGDADDVCNYRPILLKFSNRFSINLFDFGSVTNDRGVLYTDFSKALERY